MPYSYRSLCAYLTHHGIDASEAKEEAVLLMAHFCGVNRADLLCDRDRSYENSALDEAVRRRAQRYPLQYILGAWEFFGCTFAVDERCLIPRPDTEVLVEEAVKTLPRNGRFADLCTGSGCIAVAVLAARPDLTAVALELFPDTLALAVQNAEINGVADRFTPICADLLIHGQEALAPYAPFDAILSNPPYIPKRVVDELEPELFFEPRAALDGGEDGLTFYHAILKNYTHLLAPDGRILLEIGYDQGNTLEELGRIYLPRATARIIRDLGGNDRVVSLVTKGQETT